MSECSLSKTTRLKSNILVIRLLSAICLGSAPLSGTPHRRHHPFAVSPTLKVGVSFLAASDISFFSGPGTGLYSGTTAFTSGGELVPVPEASTLLAVLGLIAPLAWRERRHWMRCREARGN